MKELQNRIMQMLKDRKTHSRAVALIAALSMITAFIVPYAGMVPGVAMTEGQTTAAEQMDDEIVTEETFTDLFEAEDTEAVQLSDESEDDDEEAVSLETIDMMKMAVKGLGNALLLAGETSDYYFYRTISTQTITNTDNFFTHVGDSGNTAVPNISGYSGTYTPYKLNNGASFSFTPTQKGTLTVVHGPRTDDKGTGATVGIYSGDQLLSQLTPVNGVSTYNIDTPNVEYTVKRITAESYAFYLQFTPDSASQSTNYKHNFTEYGLDSADFTFTIAEGKQGDIENLPTSLSDGTTTYSKYWEFNGGNSITFTAQEAGTFIIYQNRSQDNKRDFYLDGSSGGTNFDKTQIGNTNIYKLEHHFNAGEHTVKAHYDHQLYYIEFVPDTPITTTTTTTTTTTLTVLTVDTSKYYYITHNDTKYFSYDNGALKQTDSPAANNGSIFQFEDAGDGYYYINVLADGVTNNSLEGYFINTGNDRGVSVTAEDHSSARQKFQVVQDETGAIAILVSNESTGHDNWNTAIDASSNGTDVKTYYFADNIIGANQKISLVPTTYTPPETPSNGSTGWQHNFTENGLTAAKYTFSNCVLNDIDPIAYGGKNYTKELYFFPSEAPSFRFDAPSDGKLIIYNNKYADKTGIFISDDPNAATNPPETLPSTKEELVAGKLSKMEYEVSEGINVIKPKYGQRLYYIEYVPYENTASSIQSGQAYTLHTNNGKGFVLSSDGTKLVQFPEDSAQDTTFVFEDAGDGSYYIKNGDKYVTIGATPTNNKQSFTLEAKNNSAPDRQKFIVDTGKDDDGNTYFTFKSKQKNGDDEFYINATHSQDDTENNRVSPYTNTTGTHAGNQQFTLVPVSTENTAANLAGKTIMLRNVHSNLYLEAPDSGNLTQQNKGNDDEDQQFLLEDAGNGYYYIKSVGKSTAQNGKYVTIGTDGAANGEGSAVMLADKDTTNNRQKFKFTKNTDGSYTISPKSNEEMCIEIGSWATNAGAEANQYWIVHPDDDPNDNQANKKFFMEVVSSTQSTQQTDTNTPLDEGKIRIEARVIFGDYNDRDDNQGIRYREKELYAPKINLYYRDPDLHNTNSTKIGELVVDETEARKDWCYQYNCYWDVDPIQSGENNGYYVELTNNDGQTSSTSNGFQTITMNNKQFKVYYLRDDYLGHPGADKAINSDQGGKDTSDQRQQYNVLAKDSFRNDSGPLYIFLDPINDLNGNPNTFDLSMKKRWDGHNSDGYQNRPKEKIEIQLQVWNGSKWVEYTNDNYYNEIYYSRESDAYTLDLNGISKDDVFKSVSDLSEENRLKITVKGRTYTYQVPQGKAYAGKYIDKRIIEGMAVGEKTVDWKRKAENVDAGNRLSIYLPMSDCNNIVLTYDGKNNPQHFTNGYYYNWKAIPKGQYRVIETRSFYDVDGDDEYDEGIDRDTSQEYYYMEFPPSRDSKGVLHIQNFTKDMVLDVEKQWYSDDEATNEIPSPNNKPIVFDIYRSLSQIDEPSESMEYVGRYETGADGKIELKTTQEDINGNTHPELKLRNENGQKYFYYIKEVGVKIDGNTIDTSSFTQIGNNHNGFVASKYDEKNEKWIYGADFEAGDGRKFVIKNQQHYGIKVEKKFKINGVDVPYSKLIGNKPEVKFELYGSSNMVSNPTINSLTKIGGERTVTVDGDGTVRFLNTDNDLKNQIVVPEMFNGTDTTGSGGVFKPDGLNNHNNMYYTFDGSGNKRLYVKPPSGKYDGTLVLTFTDIGASDVVKWRDQTSSTDIETITLSQQSDYHQGEDLVITFPLNEGDNKSLRKDGGNPKLKSAVFYPDYYYYIRELPDSTGRYTLSNGDSNGFVKTNGNNYYLNLTSEAPFANATAVNEPNKMQLSINKKWYKTMDGNAELTTDRPSSYFKLYKATAQMKTVNMAQLTQVTDFTGITLTGLSAANGIITKTYGAAGTIEDLPTYIQNGTVYNKLYYYIQEVDSNGNALKGATLRNADSNDFIEDAAGNYGSYLDEDGANARTYNFKNVPTIDLKVKKTWGNGADPTDEVTIYLYRSAQASNGTQSSPAALYSASPKNSASALIPDTQSDTDNTETNNTPISSNKILRAGTLKMVMNKLRTDDSVDTIDEALPETNDVHILYKAPRTPTNGVKLLADRVNAGASGDLIKTIILESSDVVGNENWTIEIKDLPVYDSDGYVYNYWVKEDNNVAKNYNVNYIYNGSNGNCINASNPENGSIEVINNNLNTDSIYLPEAGGNGTRIYYIASGIILLLTTLGYITYRSRKASLREE